MVLMVLMVVLVGLAERCYLKDPVNMIEWIIEFLPSTVLKKSAPSLKNNINK